MVPISAVSSPYSVISNDKSDPSCNHSIHNMKATPTSPSAPFPSLVASPVKGTVVLDEVGAADPVGELEVAFAFAVLFNALQICGTNVANAAFSVSFPPNNPLRSTHTLKFSTSTRRRVLETWQEDGLDLVTVRTVTGVIYCSAADGCDCCAVACILIEVNSKL